VNTPDRYEILGELGRGATSVVYDARDLITDARIALKLIESPLCASPISAADRLRFLAEAMPQWRLSHPNIVRVYDAGHSDGRLYIAMESLDGRTLRQVLDESPLSGVPRSLRIASELASGLAHAHERGVLHRYLKPSNIFVFADGCVKIADFGMASFREAALGSSPNHAACLSYMSPEEIRRDAAIDGRCDIFSLGVVLYEMLAGKRPFNGDSPDEIMRNILESEPPLPSETNADVPHMVDLLVWSMLAKLAVSRASSAGILARRLRRLSEEVDGALAAHAGNEEVYAAAEATDERTSGSTTLKLDHQDEDSAPSATIIVRAFRGLGEVDGALAARARDEDVPVAMEATGERTSGNITLTPDHQVEDRAPSAEIIVHAFRAPGDEVDGALAAHAGNEEVYAAAEATDERTSGSTTLKLDHQDEDSAPRPERFVPASREFGEEVDEALAAHERVPAAETLGERASGDGVLMLGDRGAPQQAKLPLPTYALTILILAAAASGFLWQWRESLDSSKSASAIPSERLATAITLESSISDEPRLSAAESGPKNAASEPEPKKAVSKPDPKRAVSEPEPQKAVSGPEPKKRASKAPARKPPRSVVASGNGPTRDIEPPAVALAPAPTPAPAVALAPAPTPAPVPVPTETATLVFDVLPWGEIYIDGKLRGTTPPVNSVALSPGRHRIEVRNSARPPYVSYTTLEPGDVRPIRHHFE
jgi:hypothetical protein